VRRRAGAYSHPPESARTPPACVRGVAGGCISGLGFGFRVSGFGFWVSGFDCRISGSIFRLSGSEFRVPAHGFRVSGFGLRVDGFVFRVSGGWVQVLDFGSTTCPPASARSRLGRCAS